MCALVTGVQTCALPICAASAAGNVVRDGFCADACRRVAAATTSPEAPTAASACPNPTGWPLIAAAAMPPVRWCSTAGTACGAFATTALGSALPVACHARLAAKLRVPAPQLKVTCRERTFPLLAPPIGRAHVRTPVPIAHLDFR